MALIVKGQVADDEEQRYKATGLKDSKELSSKGVESLPSELVIDPYYQHLYHQAILTGKEKDKTIRVNVVGNFAQGKTSLTKRLVGQTTEGVQSTNSVEINHCKYKSMESGTLAYPTMNDREQTDIVDRVLFIATAEQEKMYTEITGTPAAQSRGTSTSRDPYKTHKLLRVVKRRQRAKPTGEDVSNDFQAHKEEHSSHTVYEQTDTGKSLFTKDELNIFIERLNDRSIESRYKEDGELEIWDFGGQFVFYATHTLFHSRRALYLLVFDLSKPLHEIVRDDDYPWETGNKNMEYFAKFWLNSIHSYVGSKDGFEPRVILVGTHKDKLVGAEAEKERLKDAYFDKVRSLFEDTRVINHIHPVDFAIDNTEPDDSSISKLRQEIVKLGTDPKKVANLPAHWIPLEKSLRENRYQKIIRFERIFEIDSKNEFPLNDKEQIKLFLRFHHSKGTVFYFDEEPISDYVVLDPQYLIDAFKCLITSERFCKNDPSCRPLWNILRNEARLEEELVEKLWDRDKSKGFGSHKHILLMFLQKHFVISEASEFDEHSGKSRGLGWYVVPSLLRDLDIEDTLKLFLDGKAQTSVRFVMSFFDTSVVQVVYHRLLAALVGRWSIVRVANSGKKSLLFENFGVLRLDDFHAGIVENKFGHVELRVVKLDPTSSVDSVCADRFRRFSESVVSSEFKRLRDPSDKNKKPFMSSFRCNHSKHGLNGSTNVLNVDSLRSKISLPCPDLMSHTIYAAKVMDEWFQDQKWEKLIPDCQLSEKQISKIAQAIGQNWEFLGTGLGLRLAEIQRISMDNQTIDMKIYRTLLRWKDMKGQGATINVLVKTMEEAKKVHVEWDEIRNIADEITGSRYCTHL